MKLRKKKLLIVVDGSPQSLDAVRYVAQRCAPAGTKLTLMYVMPPKGQTHWDPAKIKFSKEKMEVKSVLEERDVNSQPQRFLADAKPLLMEANIPAKDVRVIVQEKNAAILSDIMTEAAQGYDAVVVGRLGFTDTEALSRGSISAAIARESQHIPVWVIGGDIRSKEILLAVDGSDNSFKAVSHVGSFYAATETKLTLFHVLAGLGCESLDEQVAGQEADKKFEKELETNIPHLLRRYIEDLQKSGVVSGRISTRVIIDSSSPSGDIHREAKERGYGTIVIGRRGLSTGSECAMGRIAKEVLDQSEGLALWIVP